MLKTKAKLGEMPAIKVFNPDGDDTLPERPIWGGNTTNLMQLNDVRHPWAVGLYRQMRENFWVAEKIDITQDVNDYNNLTERERRAYDGILAYLTFLDSVQTVNLPQLKLSITAPEVSMCMAEQISQEALHNQSYQYLIEGLIPPDRRSQVYDFWRTDKVLRERCLLVSRAYQRYVDEKTPESYFEALWADYLLEGLYFWNGFQFFYVLSSRQLMPGTADIIKYINRDELSHVRLFQKIMPEAMASFPHSRAFIEDFTAQAVEQECLWSGHIVGDDILGITSETTQQFTKHLANLRLRAVGLEPIYAANESKNPYRHLEGVADIDGSGGTKANFFETTVTSYNQSGALSGWDEF